MENRCCDVPLESSSDIYQRLLRRRHRSTWVVEQPIHGLQFRLNRIRLGIRRHHHTPLVILPADIVEQQRTGLREQEYAAEHVLFTQVSDEFRLGRRITDRDAKVIVVKTLIGHHLCSCMGVSILQLEPGGDTIVILGTSFIHPRSPVSRAPCSWASLLASHLSTHWSHITIERSDLPLGRRTT